jgi:hypothetical protein
MPAIRALDASDAELIYRHRFEMFRAMGRDESDLAPMMRAFRAWLPPRLADGSYFG